MRDSHLIERFFVSRDEAAFTALVGRHGPMVLGVCERLLRNRQDAEDAYQATFLALARRAGSIKRCDRLGPWLHRVAVRIALRTRIKAVRRRHLMVPLTESTEWVRREPPWQDDGQILQEELDRLPDRFRLPLVLCYFEGKTNEEAAWQLQWPLGTVKGRIWRARAILRGRLSRRGLALTGRDVYSGSRLHDAHPCVSEPAEDVTGRDLS